MSEELHEMLGPEAGEAVSRAESSILRMFVAARVGHILAGGLSAVTAWRSYRRPRLMLAALALTTVESGWLVRRCVRRGAFDESLTAWVDGAAGVVGLVALAGATTVEDRTTWANWMSPLAYTTCGALALGLDVAPGAAAVAVLGGTYMATVASSIRRGGSLTPTALANAMSYGGFFLATSLVVGHLRRSAIELQEARTAAVETAQRLGAERERTRQHRLVHDSALQTLEAVAAGWGGGDDMMLQQRAAAEGTRLRAALHGDDLTVDRVEAGLSRLCEAFRALGVDVELVVAEIASEPSAQEIAALCDAAGEAIRNARKHAGVNHVAVAAAADDTTLTVTIRDEGAGFDAERPTSRFGIAHSILGRMQEVGGDALIESVPGRGTVVTLTIPRPKAR